jgi:hypothetical protein
MTTKKTTKAKRKPLPDLLTCPRCDGDGEECGAPVDPVNGTPTCSECKGTGKVKRRIPKVKPILTKSLDKFLMAYMTRADDVAADAGLMREEVAQGSAWYDNMDEVEEASLTDEQRAAMDAREEATDAVADALQEIEDLCDGGGSESLYSLTGDLADALVKLRRAEREVAELFARPKRKKKKAKAKKRRARK